MLFVLLMLAGCLAFAASDQRTVVIVGPNAAKAATKHSLVVMRTVEAVAFPPGGKAYAENAESHRAWRRIHLLAPDLVLFAGQEPQTIPGIPSARFNGTVPREITESRAAAEMMKRLARTPIEVAQQLEPRYGHALDQAVYIPAMALIARMRFGQIHDVRRIAEPYADGSKNSLDKPTGSHLSGHLLFAELAEKTGDNRYVELVRRAADLDPAQFHNEMSDAVFMSCPILAKAGKLTKDRKYFDKALDHFRSMEKLCVRPDGLYRHSPLNEAAWGRGNAFPALGLALTLQDMPADHPAHPYMRAAYIRLLEFLSRHQDSEGMWHQVVDRPESYAEYSATAMIGRAMAIGIRHGWLPAATYQPRVDAAWRGIRARTGPDGVLMDVCESTGKQKTVEDYFRRTAIWDRDPRGGGMAMLFALELERSR